MSTALSLATISLTALAVLQPARHPGATPSVGARNFELPAVLATLVDSTFSDLASCEGLRPEHTYVTTAQPQSATTMGFKLPFLKSPPPPPPLEPQLRSASLPTFLAIVLCWLVPALLLMRSQRKPATTPTGKAKPPTHRGVVIGSWMSFLSVSAAAITFPFMQARRDALGCDALCQGGQTSMRSALALVGAVLIGRASDRLGRVPMLWVGLTASLASLAISAGMDTIEGMWLAIVPVALLNQNFSVAKALFSDYIDEVGGTDADRAGAVGKLGMAVGLSFMAGPVLATQLVSDYRQAIVASAVVTASSAIFVFMLPSPKSHVPQVKSSSSGPAPPNGPPVGLDVGLGVFAPPPPASLQQESAKSSWLLLQKASFALTTAKKS